jgi:hypothetical protein
MLLLHNFQLFLMMILGTLIEEKKMVACRGVRITPTSDFSLANPHGGDQWNKSTNTARKINFSL